MPFCLHTSDAFCVQQITQLVVWLASPQCLAKTQFWATVPKVHCPSTHFHFAPSQPPQTPWAFTNSLPWIDNYRPGSVLLCSYLPKLLSAICEKPSDCTETLHHVDPTQHMTSRTYLNYLTVSSSRSKIPGSKTRRYGMLHTIRFKKIIVSKIPPGSKTKLSFCSDRGTNNNI